MEIETNDRIMCRGIRGATTVSENDREEILAATRDLLRQIVKANGITPDEVASIVFTMTSDLNAEYPALAARQLGWATVPLLCAQEINNPGGLPGTIRILMHWNTVKSQTEIQHIYTNGAEILRPDIQEKQERST